MLSVCVLFEYSGPRNVRFVVQKHNADRAGLHYDLRIEYGKKLKSWASRNLPQAIDGKKIMLFSTPDHDLEWLTFTGVIEDGYGKGTVEIWDSGQCEILQWKKNKIKINFFGKKLFGIYSFILYKENWLLIKN